MLSSLLLFWLFNRMTGSIWRSAFVAALFALHPLRVQSVVWIAERKDVLSAFFWMLTLCLYVYYTEKPVIRRYLLVVLFFVCALMSKAMVVTLPVIMILLDYWPLKRFQSNKDNFILWQLREKIPLFVFSAVFSIITFYAQNKPSSKILDLGFRIANAPVSFVTYLEKTFWPHDLAVFYPFPDQLSIWQVSGAIFLIIVISAAIIAMARRLPYLFVGWLWYAIALLPVIGICQKDLMVAMSDHYAYLPSIGIAIMMAWGIPSLFPQEHTRKRILFPAAIIFFAIITFLTWKQCSYWRNSTYLWNHALKVTKDNALTHGYLAYSLAEEGKLGEAVYHYNEAIRLQPDYANAYYNRGSIYTESGQYQKAIQDYTETIRIIPDYILAYFNRGMAYSKIGRYQEAIGDYNESIRLKPDYADAYNNRSAVYLNMGDIRSGCRDAIKACELGSCKILEVAKSKGDCP
jgi:tetratricopeptide (TPR) repeat protein